MSRSLKKGPYIEAKLEAKILAMAEGKSKKGVIKTWSRRSTISPDLDKLSQYTTVTSLYQFM